MTAHSQKAFSVFTVCSREMRIFFSFLLYTIVKVQVTLFQIPQIPLFFELFSFLVRLCEASSHSFFTARPGARAGIFLRYIFAEPPDMCIHTALTAPSALFCLPIVCAPGARAGIFLRYIFAEPPDMCIHTALIAPSALFCLPIVCAPGARAGISLRVHFREAAQYVHSHGADRAFCFVLPPGILNFLRLKSFQVILMKLCYHNTSEAKPHRFWFARFQAPISLFLISLFQSD